MLSRFTIPIAIILTSKDERKGSVSILPLQLKKSIAFYFTFKQNFSCHPHENELPDAYALLPDLWIFSGLYSFFKNENRKYVCYKAAGRKVSFLHAP
jgi:hypothetical protein